MKIAELAEEGCDAAEIGKDIVIPRARVIRLARTAGIKLAGAGGRRRIKCGVKNRYVRTLDRLATMARISRSSMAERLLSAILEDDGRAAVKLLGKAALPKRRYKPRTMKTNRREIAQ